MNIESIQIRNNINNNNLLINLEQYEEYYIIKENRVFKIIIKKRKNGIIIKYKNYETKLNINNLFNLANIQFDTIDEAYQFIINLFEENKVLIKNILINKSLKLLFNLNSNKNIEILLLYKKENINLIKDEMYEYNKLKDDLCNINDEVKLLRREINKLKNNYNNSFYNNNQILNDYSNNNIEERIIPEKIKINNYLTIPSFAKYRLDNTFIVFKSIDEILYLIYSNERKYIISYNLIDNKKIIEIKNAHNNYITNLRHYFDEICKRDLMISISCEDNNIKLWNVKSWECLVNIKNINSDGDLDSACFLRNDDEIYIITSNDKAKNENHLNESIKVFDINGNKIKEINDSNENVYFIDTYYDKKLSKSYIISGNFCFIKSFDFNLNEIYHIYCDEGNYIHRSIIINTSEENVIKLLQL